MRRADEAALKVGVKTRKMRLLVQECPRCTRPLTAANVIEERGTDSGSVLLCPCGFFAEFQD